MLGKIMTVLFAAAAIFGLFCGNFSDFDKFVTDGADYTVTFIIKIAGAICFFCGAANIASEAGLIKKLSRAAEPFLKRLIPSAFKDGKTAENASLNISSNILGLGNAATPFGIAAARGIYKTDGQISRSLAMFILLNTSSLQLIPSTVIALRQAAGAKNPSAIVLPVIITQLFSLGAAVLLSFAFFGKDKNR